MDLVNIILSEVRKRQYYMISLIYEPKKMIQMNLYTK